MGFALYHRTASADGAARCTRIGPARMGGQEGMIALHVAGLDEDADGKWLLGEGELLAALAAGDEKDCQLLFETPKNGGGISLSRVVQIAGMSLYDRTDMVIGLRPLEIVCGEDGACETREPEAQLVHESLSLSGGTGTGPWAWKWQEAPMSIGGVRLG